MSSLLLTTKLYLPPALDAFIERPRLAERLNAGLSQGHPLILVSAPAGFGKSTLLSQWLVEICQQGVQVAWLSLDPGDNDLQRFLSYLLATFQRARPGLGSEARAMLSADFTIPYETILTSLLNEIGEDSTELILALDDYHVITNLDVHQAVRFLLEAIPQNLHLVLAGRVDPPLPLARLRARGLLTELRLKDLRFTHAEMDEMIRTITGLELGEEDLAALEERTEGWGAGLRLATISLEERPGREARPAGHYDFSGSERHAMDYIIDEVLCCLPQNVRTFLLQTSVLEQFSAALCQAVVESESSDAQGAITWTPLSPQNVGTILDFVEKSNLFLVPLDAQGEWFRFHHLFQQALQHQLRQEHPERVPGLHRRAAAWLAAHDQAELAIRHALAYGARHGQAADFNLAADILEQLGRSRPTFPLAEIQSLLYLINQLPEEVLYSRVMLLRWKVQLTFSLVQYDACERLLGVLERRLAEDELSVEEEARTRCVAGIYRAQFALMRGEIQSAHEHLCSLEPYLPAADFVHQRRYYINLGQVLQSLGNIEEAEQAHQKTIDICVRHGYPASATESYTYLIDIALNQGRIGRALRIGEDYFDLAGSQDLPESLTIHARLGKAEYILNRPEDAILHLERSLDMIQSTGALDSFAARHFLLALAQNAAGKRAAAEATLKRGERIYALFPVSSSSLLSGASRTRLWLHWDRLEEAAAWANAYHAFPHASYPHEEEDNTLAWVWICLGQPQPALELLESTAPGMERKGYLLYLVENLALQALALQRLNRPPDAFQKVRQALRLAEPEKLYRFFLDCGPEMEWLLHRLGETLPRADALQHTLHRLAYNQAEEPPQAGRAGAATPISTRAMPLAELPEPLSERELEVLGLVASGMTNAQIAARMVVSENTVKKHINHIFGKLDVANRTQAILKARQVGLI